MKKCDSPISAQLVIPASFAECLTYEKQILWLKKEIDSLSGGGDPDAIAELQRKVETLESKYTELQRQINNLPIDTIENELAVISSDIQLIKNSLDTKQDVLTWDNEPTAGSQNPVHSEGILEAIHNEGMRVEQLINGKVDEEVFNEAISNIINNYVTTGDLTETLTAYAKLSDIVDMATKTELTGYATKTEIENLVTNDELTAAIADLATKSELADKQDKLTFDNIPTAGSDNVLTSGTIYEALQNVTPTVTVDDTVTDTSSNPVKSSGIYNFVKNEEKNFVTKEEITGFITEEDLADYATKTELADYATKTELADYATKTELADYATKTELTDYATKTELADYAKSSDITDMATKTELANYAKSSDLEAYATKNELGDYVKDEELTNYTTKIELEQKQDKLTFDNTPTLDSINPVTSDGIKKAIDAVVTTPIIIDSSVSQSSNNPVSSNGIYNFVLDQMGDLVTTEQLATKQDKLTFDQTPTAGSSNPVSSSGIKAAIDTATSDMLTKTEASSIYATKGEIPSLDNYVTKPEISDMATMNGKLETITETIEANEAIPSSYLDPVTATFTLSHVPVGGYTINSEEIYEYYRFGASNVWYKKKSGTSSIEGNVITVVTSDDNDGSVYDNPGKNKITVTYQYKSIGLNDCETKVHAEATYAKKEEIPNVSGFITKTVADETYAKKDEIPTDVLTKTEAASTYATKEEIPNVSNFITESEVDNKLSNYVDVEEFNTSIMNKQDKLTFDETPTQNSQNPVTSAGIWGALQLISGGSGFDELTEVLGPNFNGANPDHTYIEKNNNIVYRGQNYMFCRFVSVYRMKRKFVYNTPYQTVQTQKYNSDTTFLYSFIPSSVYSLTKDNRFYEGASNAWYPNTADNAESYQDIFIQGMCIIVEL